MVMNRTWKRITKWTQRHAVALFLASSIALIMGVHFYISLFVPLSREKSWKEVQVSEGMSFKAISGMLKKEGIIRYRGYFELLGRVQGVSRRIRFGYYGLGSHMSLMEVLETLRKGRIIEYEVVIPEGYNLYQIGWTLSGHSRQVGGSPDASPGQLISDPQHFIRLVKNRAYVSSLGIQADTLEGYLFPDTYYFPKGIKLEDIPRKMVQRYRAMLDPGYLVRGRELGLNENQLLTLASIIEKEAKATMERNTISAVYHNRLKIGMKLQADPTAVYGMKAWITKVTREDLKRKSPYNTYLRKGLPPGPIANPGRGAILAALYPEKVDYLFFVAQGDGSHYFSKEFGSHEKAIRRYRAKMRAVQAKGTK